METAKSAGQPLNIRVQAASVSEVANPNAAEERDPLLDPAEDSSADEQAVTEDPILNQEGDDDDIFSEEDTFVAPNKAALSNLEDVEGDDDSVAEAISDTPSGDEEVAAEEGAPEQVGAFTIFSTDCLRCTHLTPDLKSSKFIKARAFTKCHHENGNKDCPAASVIVVVGIPIEKVVKSYMSAYVDGDHERLAHINAKLATKDPAQRQMAQEAINKALRAYLVKNAS